MNALVQLNAEFHVWEQGTQTMCEDKGLGPWSILAMEIINCTCVHHLTLLLCKQWNIEQQHRLLHLHLVLLKLLKGCLSQFWHRLP